MLLRSSHTTATHYWPVLKGHQWFWQCWLGIRCDCRASPGSGQCLNSLACYCFFSPFYKLRCSPLKVKFVLHNCPAHLTSAVGGKCDHCWLAHIQRAVQDNLRRLRCGRSNTPHSWEQKNQTRGSSFLLDHAQHMPCSCCHCCSILVALAGHILQLTSAPCSTQQRDRGTSIYLCSLLTPCLTLGAHLKEITLGQASIQGHHSFCCHLSSLQGCRRWWLQGSCNHPWSPHREPRALFSAQPGASSSGQESVVHPGCWGQPGKVCGEILHTPEAK